MCVVADVGRDVVLVHQRMIRELEPVFVRRFRHSLDKKSAKPAAIRIRQHGNRLDDILVPRGRIGVRETEDEADRRTVRAARDRRIMRTEPADDRTILRKEGLPGDRRIDKVVAEAHDRHVVDCIQIVFNAVGPEVVDCYPTLRKDARCLLKSGERIGKHDEV